MWSSPFPMKTSKINLHVEQFSLKTGNWQKDSLINKAISKIRIESGRKIREATVGLGPVTLEGASEKGNIARVEWVDIFPGE